MRTKEAVEIVLAEEKENWAYIDFVPGFDQVLIDGYIGLGALDAILYLKRELTLGELEAITDDGRLVHPKEDE